jgi:hypothetical protein
MYHIERALKYLRAMVGNKARVEGSIAESFLLKEITYFQHNEYDMVEIKHNAKLPGNDD